MSGTSERTALYRIFGEQDVLLYVGISKDFGRRWKEEAKQFPWWEEASWQTVHWHDTREDAKAAETATIKAEKPRYNIQHAGPQGDGIPDWQEKSGCDEWVPTMPPAEFERYQRGEFAQVGPGEWHRKLTKEHPFLVREDWGMKVPIPPPGWGIVIAGYGLGERLIFVPPRDKPRVT